MPYTVTYPCSACCGPGGGGVSFCGCTGLPSQLFADITGAYTGTVELTWDGTSKYTGTFTAGGCTFMIELTCADPDARKFKTHIFTSNTDCSVCNNEDLGAIAECDPFELVTSVPLNGAGGSCPFWQSGAWGVHYYE